MGYSLQNTLQTSPDTFLIINLVQMYYALKVSWPCLESRLSQNEKEHPKINETLREFSRNVLIKILRIMKNFLCMGTINPLWTDVKI